MTEIEMARQTGFGCGYRSALMDVELCIKMLGFDSQCCDGKIGKETLLKAIEQLKQKYA